MISPAQIEAYAQTIADAIGLDCHAIFDPASFDDGGETLAISYHSSEYRQFEFQVSVQFYSLTPEGQRAIIVHEVVHFAHSRSDDVFMDVVKHLSPSAKELAKDTFEHACEWMVQSLVRYIAPQMPMPPWVKTKTSRRVAKRLQKRSR